MVGQDSLTRPRAAAEIVSLDLPVIPSSAFRVAVCVRFLMCVVFGDPHWSSPVAVTRAKVGGDRLYQLVSAPPGGPIEERYLIPRFRCIRWEISLDVILQEH